MVIISIIATKAMVDHCRLRCSLNEKGLNIFVRGPRYATDSRIKLGFVTHSASMVIRIDITKFFFSTAPGGRYHTSFPFGRIYRKDEWNSKIEILSHIQEYVFRV